MYEAVTVDEEVPMPYSPTDLDVIEDLADERATWGERFASRNVGDNTPLAEAFRRELFDEYSQYGSYKLLGTGTRVVRGGTAPHERRTGGLPGPQGGDREAGHVTRPTFLTPDAEFALIGLLLDVPSDLHVTVAEAGQLLSAYALAVAVVLLSLVGAVVALWKRQAGAGAGADASENRTLGRPRAPARW
ncbi:MFS transporter [Kitasatospora aureofaciens]|uniref:MFS transporter n=1 Tax=Kitasatospora aureofaciens TaxID=1894 RepID=UPI0005241D4B|nr:MFS transporter [Kitasatospora aureofaciens]